MKLVLEISATCQPHRVFQNCVTKQNTHTRTHARAHTHSKTDYGMFFFIENNLQRLVLELFGGATDTTSTAILWAVAYLLHHPDVQDRCYREVLTVVGKERQPSIEDKPEMPYLEATIMETLRFSGTSPLAFPHSVSRLSLIHI